MTSGDAYRASEGVTYKAQEWDDLPPANYIYGTADSIKEFRRLTSSNRELEQQIRKKIAAEIRLLIEASRGRDCTAQILRIVEGT